jgi:hypothetical protein
MKPGQGLADRLEAFRNQAAQQGWLAPASEQDFLLATITAELRAAQERGDGAHDRLLADRLIWFEAAGRRLVERDALAAALRDLLAACGPWAGVSAEQRNAVEAARDALRRLRGPSA